MTVSYCVGGARDKNMPAKEQILRLIVLAQAERFGASTGTG
jgi:hypothetical protein